MLNESYHNIKCIIADGIYCGNIITEIKEKFGYLLQVMLRKENKIKSFRPVHKGWVIERTFSWFDNDRCSCLNYELLISRARKIYVY